MENPSSHPRIIRFYANFGAPETVFFISLIALFFIPFIVGLGTGLLRSFLFTFFIFSLYYLIYTQGTRFKTLFLILLVLALSVSWLKHANVATPLFLEVIAEVIIMLLSFYFIFKSIFTTNRVDINTLMAAIAGYLIIGIGLSLLVYLFESLIPHSFSFSDNFDMHESYYYSFVTMSTLGYGDVTPLTTKAKGLSILITLIGQFYMAVIVGIIIGKLISHKKD